MCLLVFPLSSDYVLVNFSSPNTRIGGGSTTAFADSPSEFLGHGQLATLKHPG
uniref:Uncharacterized protein n=1 Tax=Arundo donax TaxID=35708 RepID=A0A0A9SHF4_ARUDO